jgi:hypothetical protein
LHFQSDGLRSPDRDQDPQEDQDPLQSIGNESRDSSFLGRVYQDPDEDPLENRLEGDPEV